MDEKESLRDKGISFKLWTPPRLANQDDPARKRSKVYVKMAARASGARNAVMFAVPGLLKGSSKGAGLSGAFRGLKASLPDGAGLMVLPDANVPCEAVVEVTRLATAASFHKIGFLEIAVTEPAPAKRPRDDAAGDSTPATRPAIGAATQPSGGTIVSAAIATAPAPATTRPALTPPPADPFADANTVIFIVDKSGSMSPVFEAEISHLNSLIDQLKPTQKFHIILFSDNRTYEVPRLYPMLADKKTKDAAKKELEDLTASGGTFALPAFRRALVILDRARKNDPKSSRRIVLLSDGDFLGTSGGSKYMTSSGQQIQGGEAVIQWLRDKNKDGLFRVDTVGLNADDGRQTLTTIAHENGGTFWDMPDEE